MLSALVVESSEAASITVPLNPRATYLMTNSDPGVLDAVGIDLATVFARPGDILFIEQLGDYSFDVLGDPNRPDNVTNLVGVFSSTNTLLDSTNSQRLPGALTANGVIPLVGWTTDPTFFGGLATDIGEDFYVGPAAVFVPYNAKYLFFSPADSLFSDNGDPDGDYAVRITNLTSIQTVPEVGSPIIFAITALAAFRYCRRSKRGTGASI
jgi:hypothetical protein